MKSGDEASDVAVAGEYLTALGGDDPARVAGLVSADFRNEHHAELGSGCVGRDEYARRLPGFFASFADRTYEIVEIAAGALRDADGEVLDTGSEVVVNYRFRADVDGVLIDIPGVMWISVRDGKVARRLDCWDSLTFRRQTTG